MAEDNNEINLYPSNSRNYEEIKAKRFEEIRLLRNALDEKLLASKRIIIIPHVGIDADALGSSLGIATLAKKYKKPFLILIDDPIYKMDKSVITILEETKKDFCVVNKEKYIKIADSEDLLVLVDVNPGYRIALDARFITPEKIIVIDHHARSDNTIPSYYELIDPTYSSASEMITQLLLQEKVKIDADLANYLLAGIHLDTAKLTKNVTIDTMNTVTKLMKYGADMNRVTELFVEDFLSDRKIQNLVNRAIFLTYVVAIVKGNPDEEFTREELAKAADYLLKYKRESVPIDAAFAIGQISDNEVSISARSKESVDVGSIMHSLDGGGNYYSAATKLENVSTEEAGIRLLREIKPKNYLK